MKFKLDENLGDSIKSLFLHEGFDAKTVYDENIQGANDNDLFRICQDEERCLVTLDLDFSNIINFPPYQSFGIIVLRPSKETNLRVLKLLTHNCLFFLKGNEAAKNLFIIEETRVRVHKFDEE